ncbi:MAG: sulfurtransferase [Pseudomonadota bacterium]|nr:sulfurtransferase [Pseudomonadota bacterium]
MNDSNAEGIPAGVDGASRSGAAVTNAQVLLGELQRADLVVVDARFSLSDPGAGQAAYLDCHIPGARYAHLDRDLSDHRQRGAGRHPWPDANDFCEVLSRWGIGCDDRVVVYDAGDGALAAARLWFMLRALGHREVSVLDGGWARWTALGLRVDNSLPSVEPRQYRAGFDATRLLDAEQVHQHLAQGGLLVDARAGERFRGEVEPIDAAAGHVPGAANRPYTCNLVDGRFKTAPMLRQEFDRLLQGRPPQEVVVMCGSGVTACHHLVAMAQAGLQGGGLFTGSWSGWISDPARPVAIGC